MGCAGVAIAPAGRRSTGSGVRGDRHHSQTAAESREIRSVAPAAIVAALAEFEGVGRRMQRYGEIPLPGSPASQVAPELLVIGVDVVRLYPNWLGAMNQALKALGLTGHWREYDAEGKPKAAAPIVRR